MLVRPVHGVPLTRPQMAILASVFIAMPFAPRFSEVYELRIKPAVLALGHTVARGDDAFTTNEIVRDIWSSICAARVVVADCTDRNPNVFYEIGLAHTVGTPVILLTQRAEDVPFDLRHIRYIEYEVSDEGGARLVATLQSTLLPFLTA